MNAHDIKLPPLPEWLREQAPDTEYPVSTIAAAMRQYARVAIEAHHKRWWLKERAQLEYEWVALKDLQAQYEIDRNLKGEVVVTKTPEGEIIAVTRQDAEGRILSVIAEAGSKRRDEPVECFKCGHAKHGGECVNVAPQPAEPVKGEA